MRQYTLMRRPRWRRSRRRGGVAEIIGVILLIALTIVAGIILWSFRVYTPTPAPSVSFQVGLVAGSTAWGDPTDCQPYPPTGGQPWTYPLSSSELHTWANDWYAQCYESASGNFTQMNSTEIVVRGISSSGPILLSQVVLSFVCNNATSLGGTTVLVSGSLASMTWVPYQTTQPAPDAPSLGYCGNFDAGGWAFMPGLTPANGTLYNRLGFFDPLIPGSTTLAAGDAFYLYLHNGGWPITFLCVAADAGEYPLSYCPHGDAYVPQLDFDDYHGAPPWCFTSPGACTIYLTYTGAPSTVLASIPVNTLA